MVSEFERITELFERAQRPEEIFGHLAGSSDEQIRAARTVYRRLAMLTHPDAHHNTDPRVAQEAFRTLNMWWELAQQRINDGYYGSNKNPPVTVQTRRHQYSIGYVLAQGDLATLYQCRYSGAGKSQQGVFKVARHASDNDLLSNEANILRRLRADKTDTKCHPYLPDLIDSFSYLEPGSTAAKQVNVLTRLEGFYPLTEVMAAYPNGLDPQDMTWIWRRLLVVLGYAHQHNVIHGAVLPTHILIHPEEHGLVLVDWSYAVCDAESTNSHISAVSTAYESWYPSEVFHRSIPLAGLDIFMGARCMVALLGGDPLLGKIPDTMPITIRNFFKGCLLMKPSFRPQDAWALLKEYDELIYSLWGARRFRPFAMPTHNPTDS